MYAPINLSEYVYGNLDKGITGSMTGGTFPVPTVPPKDSGFMGKISDWLKQASDVYMQVRSFGKLDSAVPKSELKTTIRPIFIEGKKENLQNNGLSYPSNLLPYIALNREQATLPNNTVYLNTASGPQGSQAPVKQESPINLTMLGIMAIIIISVVVILKARR